MNEQRSRGFLLKQRAFLKLYLLDLIADHRGYGLQMQQELQSKFEPYGYSPSHSEIYKTLHELAKDKWVRREKKLLGEPGIDFQEIVIYHLTDYGKSEMDLYKKQLKVELDRCYGLMGLAISDHYGPVKKGKR